MSANCTKAKMLSAALFAALVLSAMQSVRADEATIEVTWLGKNDKSWTDSEVWDSATPEAWQTAVITNSSLIKFKAGNGETVVSNIVVGANVSPTFQRADSAATGQHLLVQEMNGDGTLKLNRVGIHADYSNYDTCNISVAKIEAVANGDNDSWFDGGSASGKRMVVNSDITVNGFLKVYGQTTLAGKTTLARKLQMVDEAVVINNLVYAGDDATIDSASKGSVGRLTVRSGTLSPSTLPTGVTVGSLVLDGGTLSVASDFSGTIAVAEGGGTLFLEGEWTDADLVSLPSGISFVDGEDAARLDVRAAVAGREHRFSVAESGGVYVLETKGAIWNIDALDFSLMTILAGQGSPKANKSINGNSIRLWDGEKAVTFSRGIGTHAPSRWFVKLGGKGISMSVCVGVDYEAYGKTGSGDGKSPNVNFIILDVERGLKLAESGEMTDSTPYKRLAVDLAGVETIELVMDGLDSTSWDHADWADGVILMEPGFSPVTKGENGVNRWTGSGENDYWATPENWEFGLPASSATAVFDASANVILDSNKTISNIVVNAGATVRFRNGRLWSVWPSLIVQEAGGDGTMQFSVVGLQANHENSSKIYINTANIEFLNAESDCWFTAGSAEGQELVVNSRVALRGFMRAYSAVHFAGDLVLDGGSIYLSDKAVVDKLVLDSALQFGQSNDNPPLPSTGTIKAVEVHGATYDYSAFSDKTWPLSIDGGSVDIGDGSSIGSDGLEIGVLSGGYLRYTVSQIPETGVPVFPAHLSFSGDADLSKAVAVVKNTSGDAQKTYAITKTGEAYSFAELVPTDSVKWIGGIDDHWETADNWIYGAVPTEGQSVVFEQSAHIYIEKGTTTPRIATMTIGRGAVVKIETTDEWGWENEPVILFEEITGEGTLALKHASLRAARSTGRSVVNCAELQILSHANNDIGRSSRIWGNKENLKSEVEINADITGSGTLVLRYGVRLAGDNSRFAGHVRFVAVSDSWSMGGEKYFCVPEAAFTSASKCELQGRFHVLFNEGTLKFGNVAITESYGTGLYVPYGATAIVIEIAEGEIRDNYQGRGIGVYTRSDGSDYVEGATVGCAGVTIKKVGDGSLVYGMTKAHSLVVEGGHVEFTGENNNGDDASVDVTVKQGASVGSAAEFSHENPTWTNGGDVTVRHQFTFEPGGAIKQKYIVTPVTEEHVEPVYEDETFISNIVHIVETGDYTYSMRKLTIADDVDLANVVFGVTNPEGLPAVTKASLANLPRFTMFAANSLSGAVSTENDGYTPTGSEKNCKWLFRTKRNSVNEVEFYPFQKSCFSVIVR